MRGFYLTFRVAIVSFILFLLLGCIPKMVMKETNHYKLYENIYLSATTFGTWTKTKIPIPKGAIVAVMAKGKIWDTTDPHKLHWQPHQCLRFKIGADGRETHINSGINPKDPFNLHVVPSGNGGLLYLGMGTWWKFKYPQNKWGKMIVRVIVWEKGHQDRMEHDILELIRSNPNDQQFRDMVALMAICLKNLREYEKVQNLHKMIRETPEMDWDRVYPEVLNQSADVERNLGRNEKAKTYSEEALKRIRRFGNRYHGVNDAS